MLWPWMSSDSDSAFAHSGASADGRSANSRRDRGSRERPSGGSSGAVRIASPSTSSSESRQRSEHGSTFGSSGKARVLIAYSTHGTRISSSEPSNSSPPRIGSLRPRSHSTSGASAVRSTSSRFHPETGSLLVIEVKSVVPDMQAMLHGIDRKGRLALDIARERGWRVTNVTRLLVLPDDRTARRRVERHAVTFRTALPARTVEVRRWIERPEGTMHGVLFLSDAQYTSARHRVRSRQDVRG